MIASLQQNSNTTSLSTEQKQALQGFQRFGKEPMPPHLAALGHQKPHSKGKKTLILDLDETLVHSSFKPPQKPDIILPVEIEGNVCNVFVLVRPGTDFFLQRLSKCYELVIYTASLSKYANPLVDILDNRPNKVIDYRLFREHCTFFQGVFIKDMSLPGRPLEDSIIIDNSPTSYAFHQENALPILSWYDDPKDRCLFELIPLLEALAEVDDVRKYIPRFVTTDHRIDFQRASQLLANAPNSPSKIHDNDFYSKKNEIEMVGEEEEHSDDSDYIEIQEVDEESPAKSSSPQKQQTNQSFKNSNLKQDQTDDSGQQKGSSVREDSGSVINNDGVGPDKSDERSQPALLLNNKWTLEDDQEQNQTKSTTSNQRQAQSREKQIIKKQQDDQDGIEKQQLKSKSFISQSQKVTLNKAEQQKISEALGDIKNQLKTENTRAINLQTHQESATEMPQAVSRSYNMQRPVTRDGQRRNINQQQNSQVQQILPLDGRNMKALGKNRKINNMYLSRTSNLQALLHSDKSLKKTNNENAQNLTDINSLIKVPSEKQTRIQRDAQSLSLQRTQQAPMSIQGTFSTPTQSQNYLQRFLPITLTNSNQISHANSEAPSSRHLKESSSSSIRQLELNTNRQQAVFVTKARKIRRNADVLNNSHQIILNSTTDMQNEQNELSSQDKMLSKSQNKASGSLLNKRRQNSRQKLVVNNISFQRPSDLNLSQSNIDNNSSSLPRPISANKPLSLMGNFQQTQNQGLKSPQAHQLKLGNLLAMYESQSPYSPYSGTGIPYSPNKTSSQRGFFRNLNRQSRR